MKEKSADLRVSVKVMTTPLMMTEAPYIAGDFLGNLLAVLVVIVWKTRWMIFWKHSGVFARTSPRSPALCRSRSNSIKRGRDRCKKSTVGLIKFRQTTSSVQTVSKSKSLLCRRIWISQMSACLMILICIFVSEGSSPHQLVTRLSSSRNSSSYSNAGTHWTCPRCSSPVSWLDQAYDILEFQRIVEELLPTSKDINISCKQSFATSCGLVLSMAEANRFQSSCRHPQVYVQWACALCELDARTRSKRACPFGTNSQEILAWQASGPWPQTQIA